jgi:RNA ligase (TIGR02306 family)
MSSLIVEVCKIDNIIKHPNADKLSIVTCRGWNCIVGLDQYKVGDLVVFVPPDSVIPPNLIEKYNLEYLKGHGRVGTVKLRQYISQGLILDLPEGEWKEGDDVSTVLGITKYIPPEPPAMRGVKQVSKKKMNPLFDKYTDIENIKNYNDVFKEGDLVCVSEKIHGSSFRAGNLPIIIDKRQPFFYKLRLLFKKYILKHTHEFVLGSHNVQLNSNDKENNYYKDNIWNKIAVRYNMENVIPKDYIVYGEVFGPRVQELIYGLDDIDMLVFDIKYKNNYVNWNTVKSLCVEWNLKTVPELYVGKFYKELISKYTNGNSVFCPTQIIEGCVIKDLNESNNPRIGRKILKSINEEYLLRKNRTEYK